MMRSISEKYLAVLACALAAATMFFVVNHPPTATAVATERQLPIYCVQRDQRMVAISFDAAWGEVILREILHTKALWGQRIAAKGGVKSLTNSAFDLDGFVGQ